MGKEQAEGRSKRSTALNKTSPEQNRGVNKKVTETRPNGLKYARVRSKTMTYTNAYLYSSEDGDTRAQKEMARPTGLHRLVVRQFPFSVDSIARAAMTTVLDKDSKTSDIAKDWKLGDELGR